MVLTETWHGHCPSYISPDSALIFMKLFFTQRGEPEPFEKAGVQPKLNRGITTTVWARFWGGEMNSGRIQRKREGISWCQSLEGARGISRSSSTVVWGTQRHSMLQHAWSRWREELLDGLVRNSSKALWTAEWLVELARGAPWRLFEELLKCTLNCRMTSQAGERSSAMAVWGTPQRHSELQNDWSSWREELLDGRVRNSSNALELWKWLVGLSLNALERWK